MPTTIDIDCNPANKLCTLPPNLVGVKAASGFQQLWWPNTTKKTTDGLTYREMFGELGIDVLAQSDPDHTYPTVDTSPWGALRDMGNWLAANYGMGVSMHMIINHANAGNGGYVGSFPNDFATNGPATGGIDAIGLGNPFSPESFVALLGPVLAAINGDLSRLGTLGLYNEPQTDIFSQFGQNHAWYRTDGDACGRFASNQHRRYAQAYDQAYPGTMAHVVGNDVSIAADPVHDRVGAGNNNAFPIIDEFVDGVKNHGGSRWGAARSNIPFLGALSGHGYMGLAGAAGAGGIATGATGPINTILNWIFYNDQTPVMGQYLSDVDNSLQTKTMPKAEALILDSHNNLLSRGQFVTAQLKWRNYMDALSGGSAVKMAWTEQWPHGSNLHDGADAITDLAMFVAMLENAHLLRPLTYYFWGAFVSGLYETGSATWPATVGSPKGNSNTDPSDAWFTDYSGFFRRVTQWWMIPGIASLFNRYGAKNMCPVTITNSPITPASEYDNPIAAIRCPAGTMPNGLAARGIILNCSLTANETVTVNLGRIIKPGSITGKQLAFDTPWDTPSQTVNPVVNGDGKSFTFLMPKGGVLGWHADFATPFNPTIQGSRGLGNVLTARPDGATSYRWQRATSAGGAGATDIAATQAHTEDPNDSGKWLRAGLVP